jgi:hypothetical protein
VDYHSNYLVLVSNAFSLLEPCTKDLNGKLSASDFDMKQAVTCWLQAIDKKSYIGVQGLVSRM